MAHQLHGLFDWMLSARRWSGRHLDNVGPELAANINVRLAPTTSDGEFVLVSPDTPQTNVALVPDETLQRVETPIHLRVENGVAVAVTERDKVPRRLQRRH